MCVLLRLFRLFVKLVLEAPCLTPTALEIIKSYCREEVRYGKYNSDSKLVSGL